MSWWQNIPFFLVWGPLMLSSITAVLKPKQARAMMLIVPATSSMEIHLFNLLTSLRFWFNYMIMDASVIQIFP